jgi:hypothetical protein
MGPRTLELSTSRVARAPVDAVWRVFTDAARWPERLTGIEAVDHVPAAWTPGERVAFRLRIAGVVVPFDVVLDEVEAGRRVRWSSVRWTVTGTRTWTFEAVPEGTRITDAKRFTHPAVPLRWVYPRAPIVAMSEAWLRDLAIAAEASVG